MCLWMQPCFLEHVGSDSLLKQNCHCSLAANSSGYSVTGIGVSFPQFEHLDKALSVITDLQQQAYRCQEGNNAINRCQQKFIAIAWSHQCVLWTDRSFPGDRYPFIRLERCCRHYGMVAVRPSLFTAPASFPGTAAGTKLDQQDMLKCFASLCYLDQKHNNSNPFGISVGSFPLQLRSVGISVVSPVSFKLFGEHKTSEEAAIQGMKQNEVRPQKTYKCAKTNNRKPTKS